MLMHIKDGIVVMHFVTISYHTHTYTHTRIYIYIYTEWDRERENWWQNNASNNNKEYCIK